MDVVVRAWLERMIEFTTTRLRGPRVRRSTRWWEGERKGLPDGVEFKAIDAGYALPDRTIGEIEKPAREVGIEIARAGVAATARALGRPGAGLADFDQQAVDKAVEDVVTELLGIAGRHAADIRAAILDADATATDLDDLLTRVREAHRRGGNWVLMRGRTLATALLGDTALITARALGCTETEWLSRRDDRVRHTHVAADGQRRRIGDMFAVGAAALRFPGDPAGLPETWPEIAGCRCGLRPIRVDARREAAIRVADEGTPATAERVTRVADTIIAANGARATPVGLGLPPLAPVVRLPGVLAGYRLMPQQPIVPGQRLTIPGPLALALASPAVAPAETVVLVVALPSGMLVGVAGGTVVLGENVALEVVSVTAGKIVAVPVGAGPIASAP